GELDTLGAWLLERLARSGREQGGQAGLVAVPGHYQGLFEEIHNVNRRKPAPAGKPTQLLAALEATGRASANFGAAVIEFFAMFGVIGVAAMRTVARPW